MSGKNDGFPIKYEVARIIDLLQVDMNRWLYSAIEGYYLHENILQDWWDSTVRGLDKDYVSADRKGELLSYDTVDLRLKKVDMSLFYSMYLGSSKSVEYCRGPAGEKLAYLPHKLIVRIKDIRNIYCHMGSGDMTPDYAQAYLLDVLDLSKRLKSTHTGSIDRMRNRYMAEVCKGMTLQEPQHEGSSVNDTCTQFSVDEYLREWGTDEAVATDAGVSEFRSETYGYMLENGQALVMKYFGNEPEVILPRWVMSGGECYTVTKVAPKAFAGMEFLQKVVISPDVMDIGARCFKDCANLVSVVLPNGLRMVRSLCFSGCVNLENVNVPSNLEVIQVKAFAHCEKLSFAYDAENVKVESNAFMNLRTRRNLPDGGF